MVHNAQRLYISLIEKHKSYECIHIITQREKQKLEQVRCRLAAFCQQADIRMRSHRLLKLDDNKSAASYQKA